MVLAKDPWHSSVVYMDAEAFDIRLRAISKFQLFQLLNMNCDMSVPIDRSVSISFHAQFNFTASFFMCIYTLMFINKKEIMNSYKEIYIVLKFTVVCYVIFLLLAVLQSHLWKGSHLFRVLKDVKSRGHPPFFVSLNCGSSTRSACIKVCYFRYCSLFAEIDPAFQLNTRILGLIFWTGLCINWNGPLLG